MLSWHARLRQRLGCYGATGVGCLATILLLAVVAAAGLRALYRHQTANYALYAAVGEGDAPRVRALLAGGADPNDHSLGDPRLRGGYAGPPIRGWDTPLTLAVSTRRADVVTLLLDAGADVRATRTHGGRFGDRREGPTALAVAVETGDAEIVALLLARGAGANDVGTTTVQPVLCDAAAAGNAPVVRALLAAGARAGARCDGGRTPLAVARERGHAGAAEALRRAGAQQ